MNVMSSVVIRQIENGFVVVMYVPGVAGTQTTAGTPGSESETYYPTIAEAAAAIVAAL